MATRFHIVHILFRLDTGGLENGVVNLINHLDDQTYQHTLITLNGYDPEFAKRIQRDDVEIIDVASSPVVTLVALKESTRSLKPASLTACTPATLPALSINWPRF